MIKFHALPRNVKRNIAVLADILLCVLTVYLAFALRLETIWIAKSQSLQSFQSFVVATSVSILFALPIFIAFGLYRAIFRYAGWQALSTVVYSVGAYGIAYAFVFTVIGIDGVPRSIGLLHPILLLLAVGCSRAMVKFWLGKKGYADLSKQHLGRILIYGAGAAGRQTAAAFNASMEMKVIGFVDDDPTLHSNTINGVRVYAPAQLTKIVPEKSISDILLAIPSVSRARRNEILENLLPLGLHVRTLPGLMDLAAGRVNVADVVELDVDDLLGREPVKPNNRLLDKNTKNKVVLVTGAGGSIGSELCRQVINRYPKTLLILDNSEFALYAIHNELFNINQDKSIELIPLLGDVCDASRLDKIVATWRPDTIYHAAAYKHVPLVEHNPVQGLYNNIWGTKICAETAIKYKVKNFVLISTDKAVRPTNIMGASKRLAEMVLQALVPLNNSVDTIFSMVRFGNVLGSSGSVVPLFRNQIVQGGPITLTHAEITRYFMTIPEAAQLVIQSGAMGVGGDVFVLDMGEPVQIIDLAKKMITLSGLTLKDDEHPSGDIEIQVTGLRPGEKLYEELLIGNNPMPTDHPSVMKASEDFLSHGHLEEELAFLADAMAENNVSAVRDRLCRLVDGYEPNPEIVDWVYLAKKEGNLV